jgi:hypothetical protein
MDTTEVTRQDWNKLREIRRAAEEAEQRGKLSYERWKKLLDEAMVAAQGNPDLLDFLVPFARPGWKERLAKDQTDAAAMNPAAAGATPMPAPVPPPSAHESPAPLVEKPPVEEKPWFPKIKWKSRWGGSM